MAKNLPPDGGEYTHITTQQGGVIVVETDTGEIVGIQDPNGSVQTFNPGEGPPSPFDQDYVQSARAQNDAYGGAVPSDVSVDSKISDKRINMEAYGVTPDDPINYQQAYGKSAEQVQYEQWARDTGVAQANRADNRYDVDSTGLSASPATAGYVNLGNTAQSANVDLGRASEVQRTWMGNAPQTNGVNLGQAAQMGDTFLGPTAQAGRVDMGDVSQMGRTNLGPAARAGRVELGEASQMGRTDLGAASQAGRVDMGQVNLADHYNLNSTGAFRSATNAYGQAGEFNQYATNIDGTYLQDAAEMQRLAAMGLQPSAAENMYMQSGLDAQFALDRAAMQTEAQAISAADAVAQAQLSMAARTRGSSGQGLATMNAQNQTALGQARIYQDAINNLQQNNLQSIYSGQLAGNQAALTRANEMAQARGAYGELGQNIRQGDFQGAQNALALAQGYQGIDASYLAANQFNVENANANSQFNAQNANAWGQQQATLDANRNQFNANQVQQNNLNQGQMDQSAMLQNMQQANAMRLQQGQLDAGLNQYNAGNQQQMQLQQGQFDQNAMQQNMLQQNAWGQQQAQLDAQLNQYNADQTRQYAFQQGSLDQNALQQNMLQQNAMRLQQGQLDSSNNQFNASNLLTLQQNQGQMDQAAQIFNAQQQQNQAQTQGQLYQQNNQYNANLTQQQQFQQGQLNQGTQQFNAAAINQVLGANNDRLAQLRQGNQQAQLQAGAYDDTMLGNAMAMGQNQWNAQQANQMAAAEQQQAFISQTADRTSNYLTNNATNAIARQQAQAQREAAYVGAGATAVGALITAGKVASVASDKTLKDIKGDEDIADFSGTSNQRYTYKKKSGYDDGREHIGPMADELPEDVIRYDEKGKKTVDIARLILRAIPAIGDLQRRVGA